MKRNEYDALLSGKPAEAGVITIAQMTNRTPRTLIYGYTLERHDFHVYLGADEDIHVLVSTNVADDPKTGAQRSLILDKAGPGGRNISSNREFLPSKRACPELCDFEFCRLLQNYDLRPSFTDFTERGDEHAGAITALPENMLKGVELADALHAHDRYAELAKSDRSLAARLLVQAAQDLRVPADVYGGSAVVAEYGADAVVKKATAYLESIKVADMKSSSFTSQLIGAVFGAGTYMAPSQPDLVNGRVSFSVVPDGVPFKKSSKFSRYAGASFPGSEAIIGEFQGMPFLAVYLNENQVLIEAQQFGDRERRVDQWTRMFSLTPAGKKKAAKTAAA
jgi:hypothetical protein